MTAHGVPAAMLAGAGLSYRYAGVPILDDFHIQVAAGERVAVIGPSGSGKSTLLAILGGLLRPDRGDVTVAGAPRAWGDRAFTEVVAHVLQGYGLVSLLTATENVEVALRATGTAPVDATSKAVSSLADVGLGQYADHPVEDLSGGQQQRTALARALALDRPVLLADEPTAEQDPDTRATVLDLLFAPGRRTVVVATHDPEVANRCDRQVELHPLGPA